MVAVVAGLVGIDDAVPAESLFAVLVTAVGVVLVSVIALFSGVHETIPAERRVELFRITEAGLAVFADALLMARAGIAVGGKADRVDA